MTLKFVFLIAAAFTSYSVAQYEPFGGSDGNLPATYRPCNLEDHRCIGQILEYNSDCRRPVKGYLPNEVVVPRLRQFRVPYFNATYVESNLIVRNLNRCFVTEFYINRVNEKAVLGVDCPGLSLESDRTLYHHQSLREDEIHHYHARVVYPLIRVNVGWPSVRNLDLSKVETWKEVLGCPNIIVRSLDPNRSSATVFANDIKPHRVFEKESNYYRNFYITRRIVQALFCDYGLPELNDPSSSPALN